MRQAVEQLREAQKAVTRKQPGSPPESFSASEKR